MRSIDDLLQDHKATLWNVHKDFLLRDAYIGLIRLSDCGTCFVVWGYNEDGYEHVSISPVKQSRIPSWDDMAQLKDIFFLDEEEAYQIMPKKSQYVNLMQNCLHLWRPTNGLRLDDLVERKGKA